MPVTASWRTGEQGMAAFEAWCTARLWPLVRVPTDRDIGIDGFVQVTADGEATGDVFAVQVKSGSSYMRNRGGAVPIDDHAEFWRSSSTPVVAVVHDPASGRLWWANATDALHHDPEVRTITAERELPMGALADVTALLRSVRLTTDFRAGLPKGLGSLETREQTEAVWQCFALGFSAPNALIALRRVLAHLNLDAAVEAVVALSHCTPHPDIFWTAGNLLPIATRDAVAASFRWSSSEVKTLLRMIDADENGIDRGSVGQCVYMLLFEDPACVATLEMAAVDLVVQDRNLAGWAAYLAVAQADEQEEQWQHLIDLAPEIRDTFVAGYIDSALERGGVFLE
jgi:hypothetical protein